MSTINEKLLVACTKETQQETFDQIKATGHATGTQPDDLKGLSLLVLSRNQARNRHATGTGKPRNSNTEKAPEKLRELPEKLRGPAAKVARTEDVIFWRFEITRADGRRFEIDCPSGMTMAEAQEVADAYHQGAAVEGLVTLEDAMPPPGVEDTAQARAIEHAIARFCALCSDDPAGWTDWRELYVTDSERAGLLDYLNRKLQEHGRPVAPAVVHFKLIDGSGVLIDPDGLESAERVLREKYGDRLVTCWTPAGNPMQVRAQDAEHAAFLIRMNPPPVHDPDVEY